MKRQGEYELTGLQRTYLETVRDRMTDDDRASEPIADVDPDGMIFWRPARLNEQLAYMVAKWIWEDAVGE